MKFSAALASTARTATALTAARGRAATLCRWAGLVGALLGLSLPPPAARGQTPPPAVFTTLHSFSALTNGAGPEGTNSEGVGPEAGLLVGLDGNFYGTAYVGGANGNGTIFRCTPAGTVSVLHTFSANENDNADGASPLGALIQDAAGNLYGTAATGGAHGDGTAFEVTLAGGFTDLHNFGSAIGSADGANPRGGLFLTPDGLLAGTASFGGDANGDGTLFFLDGTTFGPALDFGGSLGTGPIGPLAFDNPPGAQFPSLYGACQNGGIGNGVIFSLAGAAPGGSLQAAYTFSALSNNENPDGAQPFGGVSVGGDGNLYGTTSAGGPSGNGTVWQLVVDPDTGGASLTVLHAFVGSDGSDSKAPLVQGSDGSFYGTTEKGGAAGSGVVFRVTTGKVFTVLHSFSAVDNNDVNGDGGFPIGGLVEVRPGSFVGTTPGGGVNGNGTIFEVDVPPVITSAATASGNVQSAFSYQITAADSPGSFSVSGLGDGLTFNDQTGLISGTPRAAGTLKLMLSASNDAGTGEQALTVTIKGPVPVITSATSATTTAGKPFSYTITASHSPTSFAATGLPSGLSVNKTSGVISGTPAATAVGTKTIHLSATNAGGTGSATLTLTVNPPAPVISSANTATATEGQAFSYQIKASNNPTSYNCTGKPPGLTINTQTGLLSGTPTVSGTKTLTLSATNAGGTGTETLTLTIAK